MRLVVTSDTHFAGFDKLVPDGDVFIHCGDFMDRGYESEWQSRLDAFAALPHKIKLLVAGNHDLFLDIFRGPALQDLRSAGVYVLGSPTTNNNGKYTLPNGMKLQGFPGVYNLPNWAFNLDDDAIKVYDYYVHDKLDIIISHQPPIGVLDLMYNNGRSGNMYYKRWLDEEWAKPKYWFFGHCHEAYGIDHMRDTTFYNVAMCNRSGQMVNPPIVLDL